MGEGKSATSRLCSPLVTKTLCFTVGDEAEVQSVCVHPAGTSCNHCLAPSDGYWVGGSGYLFAYFETSRREFTKFTIVQ